MVRFVAVKLAAALATVLILGATLVGAAALPWNPLQGLPHSCPYGASANDCTYPARPAWVVPVALVIDLVGLAGAAGVLAATRRRQAPPRLPRRQPNATEQAFNLVYARPRRGCR